jgi:hypothetical protein
LIKQARKSAGGEIIDSPLMRATRRYDYWDVAPHRTAKLTTYGDRGNFKGSRSAIGEQIGRPSLDDIPPTPLGGAIDPTGMAYKLRRLPSMSFIACIDLPRGNLRPSADLVDQL